MLRAIAERHRPVLEEWVVDLAPGREVVERMLAPLGDLKPVWISPPSSFCAMCWGRGAILEPGPLGLGPVLCATCDGKGSV